MMYALGGSQMCIGDCTGVNTLPSNLFVNAALRKQTYKRVVDDEYETWSLPTHSTAD